jgi:MFS family permease
MIDLIAIGILPAIALGAWFLVLAKRNQSGGWRWRVFSIAASLLILVPSIAPFIMDRETRSMYVARNVIIAAFGVLVLVAAVKTPRPGRRIPLALVGVISVAMGSWYVVGDFALRSREVIGTVTDVETRRERRKTVQRYYVVIGGNAYETTRDLFESAAKGQRVRGTIGAGSGMLISLEALSI